MTIFMWTLLVSALSAVLYRTGGMSVTEAKRRRPWKWFPAWMINTKARDIGCAFISYLWVGCVFPGISWWIHLLSFALMFGALCTYWDDVFNGVDNFYAHGGMIALAYLPYQCAIGVGAGFTLRCIILALGMGLLCKYSSDDYVEECGRGALIIATLPLLLI